MNSLAVLGDGLVLLFMKVGVGDGRVYGIGDDSKLRRRRRLPLSGIE